MDLLHISREEIFWKEQKDAQKVDRKWATVKKTEQEMLFVLPVSVHHCFFLCCFAEDVESAFGFQDVGTQSATVFYLKKNPSKNGHKF